ncbi:MAG: hypothetical protein QXO21_06560, partial [Candidatus Anstonellales archaeon]
KLQKLDVVGYDKEGNYGSIINPVWEIIGDIREIDKEGNFKALKKGTGKIKVRKQILQNGEQVLKENEIEEEVE